MTSGLALFTVWESATTQLFLAEVKPKYKRFFTAHAKPVHNSTFYYPVRRYEPNVNLILYDEIGLLTQKC